MALSTDAPIPAHDLPMAPLEPERRVALEGAYNFRDIGGYLTTSRQIVRRGVLFRSDSLHTLTDADVGIISGLGLRTVIDFRLPHERAESPSRLPTDPAPQVIELNVGDVPELGTTMVDIVVDMLHGRTEMAPASFWEEHYVTLLEGAKEAFVTFVSTIADADRLPAVFHCAGGKDRTGMAATFVLSLLGVADEVIVDDFLLTNVLRTPVRYAHWVPQMAAKGIDPVGALPILGVTRAAWERARDHLAGAYGGPLGYLLDGGLDVAAVARLRSLLLCSPA